MRVFAGAWRDEWGPAPATVRAMDCVALDVHAETERSKKGKGKAVDIEGRLRVCEEPSPLAAKRRKTRIVAPGSDGPRNSGSGTVPDFTF